MDRIRPGEAVRDTAVPDGAVRAVAGRAESIEGVRYAARFDAGADITDSVQRVVPAVALHALVGLEQPPSEPRLQRRAVESLGIVRVGVESHDQRVGAERRKGRRLAPIVDVPRCPVSRGGARPAGPAGEYRRRSPASSLRMPDAAPVRRAPRRGRWRGARPSASLRETGFPRLLSGPAARVPVRDRCRRRHGRSRFRYPG